ncbi:hypothetical protein R1flu_007654 [Riccia fluitans]|uniref:Uncharacterized protein n=1 Tax=Riccia fluitans TaxID=41844 RepID=A0ABD1Z0C9_9MARC
MLSWKARLASEGAKGDTKQGESDKEKEEISVCWEVVVIDCSETQFCSRCQMGGATVKAEIFEYMSP